MDEARFRRGLDRIAHRGPDDWGVQVEPAGAAVVHFGQRRLSILDLSPLGHQPAVSPRSGVWITYNGEVYNFQAIRAELETRGYNFRSNCDTEVILAAYDEWGLDCVHRFNGMFAIGLFDPKANKIVLIRDRIGIKPMYYFHDGGQLAFASELTAILDLKLSELRVRPDAVANYFANHYVPGDMTPLENHHKLRPGHILEYNIATGAIQVRQYWDLLAAYASDPWTDDEQTLEDRLEALLTDAVRLRLISDVPLGAFLSGGIDSSLVAALMTKVSTGAVRTFTIGFTVPEVDEAPHAKRIAAHLGCEHTELYVSPAGLEAVLEKTAGLYDEPFADSSAIPTTLLSQMTRQHVTVALSGDGGDELFCGYTRYQRADNYRRIMRLPRMMRTGAAAALNLFSWHRPRAWAYVLGAANPAQMYARVVTARIPELVAGKVDGYVGEVSAQRVYERLGARSDQDLPSATDLLNYMPEDLLTKVDRASMSVALEVRVPLMDYRFVEFSARVPHSAKYRGGTTKYLLRKVLAKHVPRELWERPKQGFGIPIGHWFRHELREWVHETLMANWDWTYGIINRREAERVLHLHLTGKADLEPVIWSLICWKLWLRRVGLLRN